MKALLVISEDGFAKRVPLADFPVQHRDTQGVALSSTPVAAALVVDGVDGDVVIATALGKIERVALGSIPMRRRRRTTETGKFAKGVRIITLAKGDRVATASLSPLNVPPTLSQTPPEGTGDPIGHGGATDLQKGVQAALSMGHQPMVPRAVWAETDVHKASTYSCAHCGWSYEHPDQVYACIDSHVEEVAETRRAA
jgi:DNA gyrase C-terminal domain, beta-propeller